MSDPFPAGSLGALASLAMWGLALWLLFAPPPGRPRRRLLRRVVRYVFGQPDRRKARRTALRRQLQRQLREMDPHYREPMIVGPGMTYTPLPPTPQPSIFESMAPPLNETLIGMPGPSQWAPARVAAMPTTRCQSCPQWGCAVKGADPECADAVHPYRPDCGCQRCSTVVTDRSSDGVLRFRLAMAQARAPRPGDEEVADPPRDLFDLQPTPRPAFYYPCGRIAPHVEHHYGLRPDHCPGGLPDPRYPPTGPRRRRSGAQRRKLRDRVQAAVAEQLRKDAANLSPKGRDELLRIAASLPSGLHCGACDEPVVDDVDNAARIYHAVGCPRRGLSVDRATLPRPGRGQAPAPNRGPGPAVQAPCSECGRPLHVLPGNCITHLQRQADTMWPYSPGPPDPGVKVRR